uniref:Uncharacterized protein n=1 Tax=uncultured marine bacterium PPT_M2 TaxID=1381397 RepID=A0A067XSQ7_9BACT|nr:hypothetical protein PPT_M2_34 [uncultured marine bacterium PPT_M2]
MSSKKALSEADPDEEKTTYTIKAQNACNREIASLRARLFMPLCGFPVFMIQVSPVLRVILLS